MNEIREARQRHVIFQASIMLNFETMRNLCHDTDNNNSRIGQSISEENANEDVIAFNNNNNNEEISRMRRRVNDIKCKGAVSELKEEGVARLFSMNFN